jgi:HSP20 family protein
MARDVIRLMHVLFLPAAETSRAWCPATDLYRGGRGWVVKFELAGVRPEDIDLEVSGRVMTLRGVRRDCATEGGCTYYRMEIAYGPFERVLELPAELQHANITTSYRDGMLFVHIETEA